MSAKKSVFVVRDDYPSVMYDLLKQTFDVYCWNSAGSRISKSQLIENIKGKYGLICSSSDIIDREVIEVAGNDLKVVCTVSVATAHMDIEEMKSRGIKVGYTPNVSTEAVAEHAVGLLIATGRRIVESNRLILKGGWSASSWTPKWMCSQGLNLSTVGIIGCGSIGTSILQKIKPFNPSRILYYSRSANPKAKELGGELKSIDFIMKESDFIILALSLNIETKGIINKERISSMKSNAIIINIGRGDLIDEKALIEALENRKIGGAGLDVFAKEPLPVNHPFLKFDNVVITPHIARDSLESQTALAELAALNILSAFNNQRMPAEL